MLADAMPPARSPRTWILAGALALLTALAFSNTLFGSFVWDDEHFILRNVYMTSWHYLPRLLTQHITAGSGGVSNLYRPLESLTHFLDLRLWGLNPFGHHLVNILLHTGTSVAIFLWLATLAPLVGAFWAALLFAVHPLQSEVVAYIPGRCETLGILFVCLGLRWFKTRLKWSLLCAALAVLSKENFVMFPVFLWLYDRATGQPASWRRHAGFWLIALGYTALRLTALNFQNTLNFYGTENLLTRNLHYRLFTYLTTLPTGLRLWLWPVDLHHERAWSVYTSLADPRVWLSALGVAGWVALAVWLWRRSRVVAAGMLWCVAATLPTSNVMAVINALFYDHWFLVPGLGLAMIVSSLPIWRGSSRWAGLAGCAVIAGALGWATWQQNRVWHDPVSLNSHLLRYDPDSAKIHNNLAMALESQSRPEEAIRLYQRAIELSDEYPETHHNLARAYEAQGRFEEAAAEYRKALSMNPRFYHSAVALGKLALTQGDADAAERAFRQALEGYPYAVEAYLGLAQLRVMAGNRQAAIEELTRGLRLIPDPRLKTALARLQSP